MEAGTVHKEMNFEDGELCQYILLHYDITFGTMEKLSSFKDFNFGLKDSSGEIRYILKVVKFDEDETEALHCVQSMHDVMWHLEQKKLLVPSVVTTRNGLSYLTCCLDTGGDILWIQTYLKGNVLIENIPLSDEIFYDIGEYVAIVQANLLDFSCAKLFKHESEWQIENCHKLYDFLSGVENPENINLAKEVLGECCIHLKDCLPKLGTGPLHGDIHDENLIVVSQVFPESFRFGLIDFGDICHSALIFELAITLTYLMISSQREHFWMAGKPLLRGFLVQRGKHLENGEKLTSAEIDGLYWAVLIRYLQELILGEWEYQKQSTNDCNAYVKCSSADGWPQLKTLWKLGKKVVTNSWLN